MNPSRYPASDNVAPANQGHGHDRISRAALPCAPDRSFRLRLWLTVLTILFVPLERLFALGPRKILRPGIGTDLGYYFLNGLLPAMLMSAPLGIMAWMVHRFVPHEFHAAVAEALLWSRVLAALVVGDIAC